MIFINILKHQNGCCVAVNGGILDFIKNIY